MSNKQCCNNDCNQGRDCPHKHSALRVSDVVFTVVMMVVTLIAAVSLCWWLITTVMMIMETIR